MRYEIAERILVALTPDERTNSIVNEFRQMPPITRREVLSDLIQLADRLPDLRTVATAIANEAEAVNRRKR